MRYLDTKGNTVYKVKEGETVGWYVDGLAYVVDDAGMGYLDKNGNIAIELKYEEARTFSGGFAAVKENGKWGFINTQGEVIVKPSYDEVEDYYGGFAMVRKNNTYYYINTSGEKAFTCPKK